MSESRQVPLMLSIPKSFRDKLRIMAAEQNLENPDQVTSASTIAREILCCHLTKIGNNQGTELCQNQLSNAA